MQASTRLSSELSHPLAWGTMWSYCAHIAKNAACLLSLVFHQRIEFGYCFMSFSRISLRITGVPQNLHWCQSLAWISSFSCSFGIRISTRSSFDNTRGLQLIFWYWIYGLFLPITDSTHFLIFGLSASWNSFSASRWFHSWWYCIAFCNTLAASNISGIGSIKQFRRDIK